MRLVLAKLARGLVRAELFVQASSARQLLERGGQQAPIYSAGDSHP